ncbi:hypothetical protein MMC12_006889 [Toensbergia leucococca]|nr:hypothetical protein [Toensbergia leucococca]
MAEDVSEASAENSSILGGKLTSEYQEMAKAADSDIRSGQCKVENVRPTAWNQFN